MAVIDDPDNPTPTAAERQAKRQERRKRSWWPQVIGGLLAVGMALVAAVHKADLDALHGVDTHLLTLATEHSEAIKSLGKGDEQIRARIIVIETQMLAMKESNDQVLTKQDKILTSQDRIVAAIAALRAH